MCLAIPCSAYTLLFISSLEFFSGMVEALAAKTLAWEKDRGVQFLYDGVSILIKF